jgi:hypothetical protein
MTEFNEFDDGTEPQTENELIKHLRKQISERDSRLKEIQKERDALAKAEGERTLTELLDGAEVPEKYRVMAKRMGIEATPDAIQEFIKDFGELWGHTVDEGLSAEELEARDQQTRAQRAQENGSKPKGKHQISEADLMNMNPSELDKYLKSIDE